MRAIEARFRPYSSGAILAALVLLAPVAVHGQDPAGGEFQVNTYTTNLQRQPSIAAQPDGKLIVAWDSFGQDGNLAGVYAQLYDAAGARIGGEFLVNTYTTGSEGAPAVAASASGEFLVVWSGTLQDGSNTGILGQRVGPTGTLIGPEFPVNTYTTGFQTSPRVAATTGGNFVVVWAGIGTDGSSFGVFGQCFTGFAPSGAEFQVNTYTTGDQYIPDVAMNAGGAFVVVWTDGQRHASYGQRYDPGCTPTGGEFLANGGIVADVGMDDAGAFVVAASSYGADGSGYSITAQRFTSGGAPLGTFVVNTYTAGFQEYPRVEKEPGGDFVVSWDTYSIVTLSFDRISARAFRASGSAAGPEIVVNTYTSGLSRPAVLAMDHDGNFVVAWVGADADNSGIKAQRFLAPDVIFKNGFNGGNLTAWSSNSNDGGDLSVSGPAAMASTAFGLQGLIDDTTGLYVQDDSPSDENRYHARFYFDPNGFDPGVAQNHLRTRIFIGFEEAPMRRLFAVVVRLLSGQYGLMGRVRQDDNSQTDTGFFPISDGPHYVEVDWKRSSGPDALDGTFQMWIDGVSVSTLTGLDNSVSSVDFARLGALSVKAGATGTLFWDEFESRRRTDIGPVP
jgi:hypothetical protein